MNIADEIDFPDILLLRTLMYVKSQLMPSSVIALWDVEKNIIIFASLYRTSNCTVQEQAHRLIMTVLNMMPRPYLIYLNIIISFHSLHSHMLIQKSCKNATIVSTSTTTPGSMFQALATLCV